MGVIIKERPKGSGEWWVFIHHNGKRKKKKIGRDKSVALDVAKKIEAKLTLGDFGLMKQEGLLFLEYAKRWLKVVVPATCKKSTENTYKGLLNNYVLPVFGKKPVTAITPQ